MEEINMFEIINTKTGKRASVYKFVSKESAEAHIYKRKNKKFLKIIMVN
jgi:hypothetical protein